MGHLEGAFQASSPKLSKPGPVPGFFLVRHNLNGVPGFFLVRHNPDGAPGFFLARAGARLSVDHPRSLRHARHALPPIAFA